MKAEILHCAQDDCGADVAFQLAMLGERNACTGFAKHYEDEWVVTCGPAEMSDAGSGVGDAGTS